MKEIGYYEKFSKIPRKLEMENWGQTGKVHTSSPKLLDTELTNYKRQRGDRFIIAGMQFTSNDITGNVCVLLLKFEK